MFDMFSNTDAIIMDMRGYPRATARAIAGRLTQQSVLPSPEFRWNLLTADTLDGNPVTSIIYRDMLNQASNKPRYRGKTVMLIDERAISASEHSGMVFRGANGTLFIGSPTTGANGETARFFAPGSVGINFSTVDVRWPDGEQLQRVGLQPDIEERPTIEGVRAGRDRVLDRAVS
jgi:C-terminal processing protease CtpA/Prc